MESPTPPSIGYLKSMGLQAFLVSCTHMSCSHTGRVRFDAIAVTDDLPFPMLARRFRFVCRRCGRREFSVMPDWSGYHPDGQGRHDHGSAD